MPPAEHLLLLSDDKEAVEEKAVPEGAWTNLELRLGRRQWEKLKSHLRTSYLCRLHHLPFPDYCRLTKSLPFFLPNPHSQWPPLMLADGEAGRVLLALWEEVWQQGQDFCGEKNMTTVLFSLEIA